MPLVADIITANLKVSLDLGQAMLTGVTPEMFARSPMKDGKPVNTNHPAFVYGHLALYGPRMLTLVGRENPGAAAPAPLSAEPPARHGM